MKDLEKLLSGGDLRSIGKSDKLASEIKNQDEFDELFKYLSCSDRIVVMRVADAVEKISLLHRNFLSSHKRRIFSLCNTAKNKELLWHLALLLPRLHLNSSDIGKAWNILTSYAMDKTNSRIVRVNSIQGLFELTQQEARFKRDLLLTILELENENIPSINARIKKLKSHLAKNDE